MTLFQMIFQPLNVRVATDERDEAARFEFRQSQLTFLILTLKLDQPTSSPDED